LKCFWGFEKIDKLNVYLSIADLKLIMIKFLGKRYRLGQKIEMMKNFSKKIIELGQKN
jgi:hypothetical protein